MERWWQEVWGEARLDLISELVCDRYVRHGAAGTVERDHEALRDDLEQYQRTLHRPEVTIGDMTVDDDKVWTRVTMRGVNIETGDLRTVSWLQLHRLDGGRIAESWMLYANDIDWR